MSNFSNIKKNFTIDMNWWELNPQFIIFYPYSELYKRDKSKDKTKSSKDMWCIFFCSDPDEELNKFYRIPLENRKEMLSDTYNKHIEWNDELIEECLERYPHDWLSAVERALKEEIDSMVERAKLMRETAYTLDRTIVDDKGFTANIKGTAKQLDDMRAKTPKLYENYEKLEQQFLKSKSEKRVRGGRRQSKSEQKLM
jgi:hypothetical protein